MKFGVVILLVFLVGCSNNSAFYYPQKASEIDDLARQPQDHEFWLQSSSGNKLHGMFHRSNKETSLGLILHFHGNRGNLSISIKKLGWLREAGFDIVSFDYSGYGLSSGRPSPKNTRDDAVTVLNYVANTLHRNNANYRKIVWGTSLGGTILIDGYSAFSKQQAFDLVIVDSAFHSYQQQADHIVSNFFLGRLLRWAIPIAVSDEYAPVESVSSVDGTRFLFVHCKDDKIVPLQFGRRLYAEIPVSKYFWEVDGCEHARPFGPDFFVRRQILLSLLQNPEFRGVFDGNIVLPTALHSTKSLPDSLASGVKKGQIANSKHVDPL